jgi:hydantoinase/carbamoylase family amidase
MGVVTALEVCRLAAEQGLDLPLQMISFLEEEGSGFGQMLLGSRIMLRRVTEDDLRERFRALDDGRSFWEHAEAAGYEPERWRESGQVLDDLVGWIEMHIEQARVLQDTGNRIGIVNAIAGYVHADVTVRGRGDHAGATPMDLRLDPTLVLAETALELERLARAAGQGTVGTIGEIEVDPCLINAIASSVRFSLDIRGPVDSAYRGVADEIAAYAVAAAERRGMTADVRIRQTLAVTPLDPGIVGALVSHAEATGEPFMQMHSGAAHDTMCVAERVPSAMVFVPCRDGISHHPAEEADPADAALAAEIILGAITDLMR